MVITAGALASRISLLLLVHTFVRTNLRIYSRPAALAICTSALHARYLATGCGVRAFTCFLTVLSGYRGMRTLTSWRFLRGHGVICACLLILGIPYHAVFRPQRCVFMDLRTFAQFLGFPLFCLLSDLTVFLLQSVGSCCLDFDVDAQLPSNF